MRALEPLLEFDQQLLDEGLDGGLVQLLCGRDDGRLLLVGKSPVDGLDVIRD